VVKKNYEIIINSRQYLQLFNDEYAIRIIMLHYTYLINDNIVNRDTIWLLPKIESIFAQSKLYNSLSYLH